MIYANGVLDLSKQRTAEDHQRHREVDDQPADIHQRRDEGGRGAGGIEPQALQHEGQHGAGK